MTLEKRRGCICVLILAAHSFLLLRGVFVHSPGWDEIGHMAAGISHWQQGNTDLYRVNPPLVRLIATIPLFNIDLGMPFEWEPGDRVGRPEFEIGRQLWQVHGASANWYLACARCSVLPLSLLAGLLVFCWGKELYGGNAGLLALLLWCFSPLVLANAQMITPDVGATAFGLSAVYAFWKWLYRRSIDTMVFAGFTLGLANLSKFTWIILFVLFPAIWWFYFIRSRKCLGRLFGWHESGQMACLMLLCIFVINWGYGFDGTMTPLGKYRFASATLRGDGLCNSVSTLVSGNRFTGTLAASLPVPLPRNYLLGIDRQKLDFESVSQSYLRGEWRDRGWWYYYLYGIAIKEPLGYVALFLLAAWHSVFFRRLSFNDCVLLLPALAVFLLVSSQTAFSRHLRYILPALPFLFIWTGRLWGSDARIFFDFPGDTRSPKITQPSIRSRYPAVWESRQSRFRWWFFVTAFLFGCAALPSLALAPCSHAYFNSLAGGPKNGHNHLLGSNLDWGQDLNLLSNWIAANPDRSIDGVAYSLSGLIDVSMFGVPGSFPPGGLTTGSLPELSMADGSDRRLLYGPRPGLWAVSVNAMRAQHGKYSYFMFFEPSETLGFTIYIFDLSQCDVERYWTTQHAR